MTMARNLILTLILLTVAAGCAHALGVGGEGLRFGKLGATAGKGTAFIPPPSCGSPTAPNGVLDLSQCSNASYVATVF